MIKDKQNALDEGTVPITVTGVSDAYYAGPADSPRNLGVGVPLGAYLRCTTALTGTSPTVDLTFVTASNAALTADVEVLITWPQFTALAVGAVLFQWIPSIITAPQDYWGFKYTIGGTTPSFTAKMDIICLEQLDVLTAYADGRNLFIP